MINALCLFDRDVECRRAFRQSITSGTIMLSSSHRRMVLKNGTTIWFETIATAIDADKVRGCRFELVVFDGTMSDATLSWLRPWVMANLVRLT